MFYTCLIDREGRVRKFAFKCQEGLRLRHGECVEEEPGADTDNCDQSFEVVRLTPDFLDIGEGEYVV